LFCATGSKDYSQALAWYSEAATQGLPEAENNLGVMYEEGLGVEKDYREAANWYRAAAEHGNRTGQYDLANLYATGRGVPLDYVSAYFWYSRAADSGDKLSARQLKSISRMMAPRQRQEAEVRIAERAGITTTNQ
jgi:uncharacterized protein